MSALHSDTHDSDSGRSSQAFPIPSLEAPRSSEVRNLGPQTSVHSSFHQRTLPSTRSKVGIFYSLAPSNQQTDGACQPRVGPVPPALCKRVARRLVWPVTYGRVPAQQPCPLHYPIASVPARHQTTSLHGLQTLAELFWSRDSQWVHRKDEDSNWQSQICDLQSTGQCKGTALVLLRQSGRVCIS